MLFELAITEQDHSVPVGHIGLGHICLFVEVDLALVRVYLPNVAVVKLND